MSNFFPNRHTLGIWASFPDLKNREWQGVKSDTPHSGHLIFFSRKIGTCLKFMIISCFFPTRKVSRRTQFEKLQGLSCTLMSWLILAINLLPWLYQMWHVDGKCRHMVGRSNKNSRDWHGWKMLEEWPVRTCGQKGGSLFVTAMFLSWVIWWERPELYVEDV